MPFLIAQQNYTSCVSKRLHHYHKITTNSRKTNIQVVSLSRYSSRNRRELFTK